MNKIDMKNISYKILQNNNLRQERHAQNIKKNVTENNFEELLKHEEQKQGIVFSKHAIEKMEVRDISLNNKEIGRIEEAIEKALEKGVKEALILMDDKAFIASIKNKTIVTSISKEQFKDNIFTNIDGAIII